MDAQGVGSWQRMDDPYKRPVADTVALPPIPGEVWDAAGVWRDEDRGLGDLFTAIWPHLYAAALQHATSEIKERIEAGLYSRGMTCPVCGAVGSGDCNCDYVLDALRRMADEATRG